MKQNEITIEDLLNHLEDLAKEFTEPKTVEELDEQTEIPDLEGADCREDAPEQRSIPKWKAVELQVLDVIGNTLDRKTPISLETAATLETLTKVRESVLRFRY